MATDLENFAADAMEEAAASHTVIIVPDEGLSIGTGVAITWQGHPVILTARHVIKDIATEQLRFFPKAGPCLQRRRPAEPKIVTEVIRKEQFEVEQILLSGTHDLAAIKLQANFRPRANMELFDLGVDSSSPPLDTAILVFGSPFDITVKVTGNSYMASTASAWSRTAEPPTYARFLGGFSDSTHFLFPNFSLIDFGVKPHGLSGSGVWWRESSGTGVWHPNFKLAGIVTHAYTNRRLLATLRVELLIDFLKSVLPADQ